MHDLQIYDFLNQFLIFTISIHTENVLKDLKTRDIDNLIKKNSIVTEGGFAHTHSDYILTRKHKIRINQQMSTSIFSGKTIPIHEKDKILV